MNSPLWLLCFHPANIPRPPAIAANPSLIRVQGLNYQNHSSGIGFVRRRTSRHRSENAAVGP
jgi:hypothetical protein